MKSRQTIRYYELLESIGPFSVRDIIRERRKKYGESNKIIAQYLKALDKKYAGVSQR